jgi:hypothetical protein
MSDLENFNNDNDDDVVEIVEPKRKYKKRTITPAVLQSIAHANAVRIARATEKRELKQQIRNEIRDRNIRIKQEKLQRRLDMEKELVELRALFKKTRNNRDDYGYNSVDDVSSVDTYSSVDDDEKRNNKKKNKKKRNNSVVVKVINTTTPAANTTATTDRWGRSIEPDYKALYEREKAMGMFL